ncbi:nickel transporter [Streptomyces sp. NPDC029004]|uniref:nickel/cobalt transporter n=1 Tax=Streptomyces sp. NPDC029004 TaxID=3154490 RepID=UPI0033D9E4AA
MHPRAVALAAAALTGVMVAGAPAAEAHPLGNFTVNHYNGLRLYPDHVENSAVIDRAEIAALQEHARVDANHDGRADAAESAAYAASSCAELARSLYATAGNGPLRWRVTAQEFRYRPGAAGLSTSRLSCELTAPARLDTAARVEFDDRFDATRIGWHEITATGHGVRLIQSPVSRRSVSDELRSYPNDLLAAPLDQRTVQLQTVPGAAAASGTSPAVPAAGFVTAGLERLTGVFNGLVGARHLSVGVGLLALLLSLVLGASHAAMPGHGKTIMAAYLAGRRGSVRDAVTVGATVTFTHSAGVLALGLLLSVSTGLAGETLLAWLGLASGLLVTVLGVALLRSSWRNRHGTPHTHSHHVPTPGTQARSDGEADPDPAAGQPHSPHSADHNPPPSAPTPAKATAAALHRDTITLVSPPEPVGPTIPAPHRHRHHGHRHSHGAAPHGHGHTHAHTWGEGITRRGLVGMGIAGGLVPSPSALVVLLGAIALGRTTFGILLVLGYGLGMAATLTAAGILLVRLRDRLDSALAAGRLTRITWAARLSPVLTAALVVLVGTGLTLRALSGALQLY